VSFLRSAYDAVAERRTSFGAVADDRLPEVASNPVL
jgi:hypothetical protein